MGDRRKYRAKAIVKAKKVGRQAFGGAAITKPGGTVSDEPWENDCTRYIANCGMPVNRGSLVSQPARLLTPKVLKNARFMNRK